MKENIIKINKNIYFDLNSSSLIFKDYDVPINNDNVKDVIKKNLYVRRKKRFGEKRIITSLNIIPTMKCEGRCLYCYNENNNNKIIDMLDVSKIKKNIEESSKKYTLDLKETRIYGGEPLLHDNIDELIFFLNSEYNINSFYLSTGLLFSEKYFEKILKKIRKIKEKNINISFGVSLDFGCEFNEFTRKNFYKLNEYDLFLRAVEISKIGVKTILVSTISKNTKINKLKDDIKMSLKFLNENKMSNNIAYRFAVACDNNYTPSYEIIDGCYDLLLENIKNNIMMTSNIFPYFDVINSQTIKKINDDVFHIIFKDVPCGIFSNMINMLPTGELIHCHMNPYNNVIDFVDFNEKEKVFYDEICDNCDYFLVCRGGCFYRKNISDEVRKKYCYWVKRSFQLALIRMTEQYGKNIENFKLDLEKNIINIQ